MTDNKPIIKLGYVLCDGLSLIILMNSGVRYTNQTGGCGCLHPIEEGVFVPLNDELADQEEMLFRYFTEDKYYGNCMNGIDEDDAGFIDRVLSISKCTKNIKVDRSRLKESHEAWIFVEFSDVNEISDFRGGIFSAEETERRLSPLYGFRGYKGVITWNNSD